jgi:hypothetical protein
MSAMLPQYIEGQGYYFRDPAILWTEEQVIAELRELGFRDDQIPLLREMAHLMAKHGVTDL